MELSKRQKEILEHISGGLINKQISELCGISVKTVEAHIHKLCYKLNANNRTHAVYLAVKKCLI